MNTMGERVWIYGVLAAVCAVVSTGVGPGAACWSFLQIVAVIELVQLAGLARDNLNPRT